MESKQTYSLPLILVGSTLVHAYLYTVNSHLLHINLLFLGFILQSTGITLILLPLLTGSRRKINTFLFLVCVLALSFSINYMNVSRFDLVTGSDPPKEVKGAKIVQLAGRWDPTFVTPGLMAPCHKYAGSLTVTIFPMIACELTGLYVESFFRFFTPMMVTLNPLFVFLMLRSVFKDSPITYLSTALWPQLFFNNQLLMMTRSAVGIPLLWLMVYTLFRKPSNSRLLLVIFAFGAVSAHYSVGYFGLFITLFFVILRVCEPLPILKVVISKPEKVVEGEFVLFHWGVTFLWIVFAVSQLFGWHLLQAKSLLESLVSFDFRGETMRWEQSFIFESPRGPIITAWFDMQFLLMGVGGLVALIECIRKRVTSYAQVSWVLMGCSLIGVLLSTMLPYVSLNVEAGRLICYFSPFLLSFMAIALLRLRGRAKPLGRALVIFFLLFMLPMNLMLPAHQNDIMYHSDKELTPERLLIYRSTVVTPLTGNAIGIWIEQRRPVAQERIASPDDFGRKEPIICDSAGWQALMLTSISTQDMLRTSGPKFSFATPSLEEYRFRYMLITGLYVEYGLWSSPIPSKPVGSLRGAQSIGKYSTRPSNNITAETLFQEPNLNLIYDNHDFSLIYREGNLTSYCSWEL